MPRGVRLGYRLDKARSLHTHRPLASFTISLDLERKQLAHGRLLTVPGKGGDMHKNVLSALLGSDETEASLTLPFFQRAFEAGACGAH
jgi:hypothetical protein